MTQPTQPAREIVAVGTHAVSNREITNREAYLLANVIARGLDKDETAAFLAVAKHTGLDPFRQQIYAWKDQNKLTVHLAVNGLRAMAVRTGEYAGQDGPFWCGADGQWTDVWLATDPPAAAKAVVMRRGFEKPVTAVALYSEFVRPKLPIWHEKPAHMLALRAEGHALKRAFPELFDQSFADLAPGGTVDVQIADDSEMPQISAPVDVDTETGEILEAEVADAQDEAKDGPPSLPPADKLGAWFNELKAVAKTRGVTGGQIAAALGCNPTADGVWRAAYGRDLDIDGIVALGAGS